MRNVFLLTFSFIMLFGLLQCGQKSSNSNNETSLQEEIPSLPDLVERGNYLVHIIGCDHCHTPKIMTAQGPVPDMDRWLMGYPSQDLLPKIDENEIGPDKWVLLNNDLTAAVGPWGVSFAANLTPHQTGLGTWTFEQFKKAMTEGKYKGVENARTLLPPMPWQSYTGLKEEDLKAMYEYLKTIKPIDNLVPVHIPPASD